jgi:hypothetical protein
MFRNRKSKVINEYSPVLSYSRAFKLEAEDEKNPLGRSQLTIADYSIVRSSGGELYGGARVFKLLGEFGDFEDQVDNDFLRNRSMHASRVGGLIMGTLVARVSSDPLGNPKSPRYLYYPPEEDTISSTFQEYSQEEANAFSQTFDNMFFPNGILEAKFKGYDEAQSRNIRHIAKSLFEFINTIE